MNTKLSLELVWWVATAVVVSVVMFPIWKDFPSFPFHITNIVCIISFITFTRYAFLLKHTFIANTLYPKIGFILATLVIVGTLLTQMQTFNVWIDSGGTENVLKSVSEKKRMSLLEYIKSEFLLFAVGSMIAAVVLAGRLLVSIWRLRNRGQA
jgi:hypothetical protein